MFAQAFRVPDVIPTATLTHDAQPEFTYGWRAGVAVTLPLFTSHRAGVIVEQTTLNQLSAQRQATLVRINGAVTAAAVTVQAQRQLYLRYRDEIIPQAQEVEQLAQDVLPARADRASRRCCRRCRRRATSACARLMPFRSFRTRSRISSAR